MIVTDPYRLSRPTVARRPIVLSIPHCGVAFPDDIKGEFVQQLIAFADDTDWFVDRLYEFAPSLGITVISAVYSRLVIDLNRHPESKPLYADGRIITNLCPLTTFLGESLYRDGRGTLDPNEIDRRKEAYFQPYHQKLTELLQETKSEFGKVLLWDCHSIRQTVPTIQKDKFPDLILGSADEQSADAGLIDCALKNLSRGPYVLQHNHPFKGGYITRNYGKPEKHQYALQLEMTKVNYMDDTETRYDSRRAEKMRELLYNTLSDLLKTLNSLKH